MRLFVWLLQPYIVPTHLWSKYIQIDVFYDTFNECGYVYDILFWSTVINHHSESILYDFLQQRLYCYIIIVDMPRNAHTRI